MLFKESDLVGDKKLDKDALALKYVNFLQGTGRFCFSSKLKEFFQTQEMKSAGLDSEAACFGFSLDWIRRILFERRGYFDKKYDPKKGSNARKNLIEKASTIHEFSKKADLNSNVNLNQKGVDNAYAAMVKDVEKKREKGYRLSELALSRTQSGLDGSDTWERYLDMRKTLSDSLGKLNRGTGMMISFVPYAGGGSGHTVGAVRPESSILYFDANIGQREFKSDVADNVADAASASWVHSFEYCRTLRLETVTKVT